jgi:hypothetical protein
VSPATTEADVTAAVRVLKSAVIPGLLLTRHILAWAEKVLQRANNMISVNDLRCIMFIVLKIN